MSNYLLTANAFVYAAAVAGAGSITGIPNVYGGMTDAERRQAVTAAKDELQSAGLISMDFDGNETVDEKLLEAVKLCSWSRQITGYDLKIHGQRFTYTWYLNMDGRTAFLTSDSGEEGKYSLSMADENKAIELLKKRIKFDGSNKGLTELVIENSQITIPDRSKLMASGASAEMADLIEASIAGDAGALTTRRLVNHVEDISYVILFTDKAVVNMDIFYEDSTEKARLTPVSASEAYDLITSLLKESEFEPFEEDGDDIYDEEDYK